MKKLVKSSNSHSKKATYQIEPPTTGGPFIRLPDPLTETISSSIDSDVKQQKINDSTVAPKFTDEYESGESYATSGAALLDKYLLSRQPLLLIIGFIAIGWIFIQDNGAGKLTDWKGVIWTLQKSGILILLVIVVFVIDWLHKKFMKKN